MHSAKASPAVQPAVAARIGDAVKSGDSDGLKALLSAGVTTETALQLIQMTLLARAPRADEPSVSPTEVIRLLVDCDKVFERWQTTFTSDQKGRMADLFGSLMLCCFPALPTSVTARNAKSPAYFDPDGLDKLKLLLSTGFNHCWDSKGENVVLTTLFGELLPSVFNLRLSVDNALTALTMFSDAGWDIHHRLNPSLSAAARKQRLDCDLLFYAVGADVPAGKQRFALIDFAVKQGADVDGFSRLYNQFTGVSVAFSPLTFALRNDSLDVAQRLVTKWRAKVFYEGQSLEQQPLVRMLTGSRPRTPDRAKEDSAVSLTKEFLAADPQALAKLLPLMGNLNEVIGYGLNPVFNAVTRNLPRVVEVLVAAEGGKALVNRKTRVEDDDDDGSRRRRRHPGYSIYGDLAELYDDGYYGEQEEEEEPAVALPAEYASILEQWECLAVLLKNGARSKGIVLNPSAPRSVVLFFQAAIKREAEEEAKQAGPPAVPARENVGLTTNAFELPPASAEPTKAAKKGKGRKGKKAKKSKKKSKSKKAPAAGAGAPAKDDENTSTDDDGSSGDDDHEGDDDDGLFSNGPSFDALKAALGVK